MRAAPRPSDERSDGPSMDQRQGFESPWGRYPSRALRNKRPSRARRLGPRHAMFGKAGPPPRPTLLESMKKAGGSLCRCETESSPLVARVSRRWRGFFGRARKPGGRAGRETRRFCKRARVAYRHAPQAPSRSNKSVVLTTPSPSKSQRHFHGGVDVFSRIATVLVAPSPLTEAMSSLPSVSGSQTNR